MEDLCIDSTTTASGNYYRGETLIYGSTMWNDASGYTDSISFEPFGTTKVFSSVMIGKAYMRTTDINFQDVKWINELGLDFSLMIASGYDYTWSGITTIHGSSSGGIFMSGTTTSAVDLYDVTFVGCTKDVSVSGGCNWLLRLINSPTFSTTSGVGSGKPGTQICYTFNVLVTDSENDPLSGALVVLKDKNDDTAFSFNTGADGKLADDQIVKVDWYRHTDNGGHMTYNDHTLKVTLNGYADYETNITIDHKIEADQVCLDALTYTYDDIMDAIQNTNPLNLLSITGSFYSPNDEVNIYSVTTGRNGTLVSSTVNVNVTYPNGTHLSAGISTQESIGRFKYNFTLPSNSPTGTYQLKINATYGSYESHEVSTFIVSPVLEDISNVVDYINTTITNTIIPYLQEINSTTYDNYNLLTEINTTTHSTLTKWGAKTAQNLYDLESQTKQIADYINDTRWGNSVFQDVLDKWGSYSASTLYTVSSQTKQIADYINDTRWGSYFASTFYSESHQARLIADYINDTRWGTKNAQDLYDISDEIKTTANYISGNVDYINNTLVTKWAGYTVEDLHSIINYINSTRWNTFTAQQLYNKANEIYGITEYINTSRWGLYSSSSLYSLSNEIKDVADYINDNRWGAYNASILYNMLDAIDNTVTNTDETVTYMNSTGGSGGDGFFRVLLSNFGEINPGADYKAQLLVFNETGCMIDADALPLITLYDSSGNAVVTGAQMTKVATGRYSYSYTTSSGQPSGQWMTLSSTIVDGNTVENVVYWELESNPPEVKLTVTDTTITTIQAELSITNEGSSPQEYTYYYWITPRVDGDIADWDTIDVASASKLINPSDTYVTTVSLSLSSVGDYYYKARVYYGTEYSSALHKFTSTKETPGGGGGGGRGGGTDSVIVGFLINTPTAVLVIKDQKNNEIFSDTIVSGSYVRLPTGTYTFTFRADNYETIVITKTITSNDVVDASLQRQVDILLYFIIGAIIVAIIAACFVLNKYYVLT